jgi:hypothetical protein
MHSKAYYTTRSIIRVLVQGAIIVTIFFGIHALASTLITAIIGSLVLWLAYIAIVRHQNSQKVA